MAEGSKDTQLGSRIKAVDSLTPSPEDRAQAVFSLLHSNFGSITDWDLLCFSVQFVAMLSERYPWLEQGARDLNGLVYTAHYMMSAEHDIETGIGSTHAVHDPNGKAGLQKDGTRSDAASDRPGQRDQSFDSTIHIRHLGN